MPAGTPATPTCTDCGAPPCARGLKRDRCRRCYERLIKELKKSGTFTSRNPRRPVLERLLEKTAAGHGACVIWTARTDREGYGRIALHGVPLLAHRVAYELLIGPIPSGRQLDHVCHTRDTSCPGGISCLHRRCVNPHHLEPVTARENSVRSRGYDRTQSRPVGGTR
ncbi:hypothetical protein GTY88_18280 [Streptomyces sp. SID5926]|nr:hypothetical protein [Streptomyces sp. SID5926]